ncbi:hypothetical protein B0H10DRAFT_2023369 [Mycena sp. CBHHK59/15]|nr:hypothetical protein B0H10DRAFT_2023369 [Mycena sp. CBHHK59/15]
MRLTVTFSVLLFFILKMPPASSRAVSLAGRSPEGPENYEEEYSPDEDLRRSLAGRSPEGPENYEEPYSPDEVRRRSPAGPLNYEEPYSPDEMD